MSKPTSYPEEYFSRFEIESELINEIVISIKDDDIYR